MPTTTIAIDRIAQSYLDAWAAKDPERIVALHADDTRFALHVGGGPAVGKDAVKATFASMFEMFPGFSFVTRELRFGASHWVLDWDLVDGDTRMHLLDVVVVDDEGKVTVKDTFADVADMNALLAARAQ